MEGNGCGLLYVPFLDLFVGRLRKNMNYQSRELVFCCGLEICTYRIEI